MRLYWALLETTVERAFAFSRTGRNLARSSPSITWQRIPFWSATAVPAVARSASGHSTSGWRRGRSIGPRRPGLPA